MIVENPWMIDCTVIHSRKRQGERMGKWRIKTKWGSGLKLFGFLFFLKTDKIFQKVIWRLNEFPVLQCGAAQMEGFGQQPSPVEGAASPQSKQNDKNLGKGVKNLGSVKRRHFLENVFGQKTYIGKSHEICQCHPHPP